LPIGGLREKILAAKQHDITEVLLPAENLKDLSEIPENLRHGMIFHQVESLADAIRLLLAGDPLKKPAPILPESLESDALQPPRG
jgi:ATP-dependent Lon protease